MSEIKDGGPAFPFAAEYGHPASCGGMSLRDYFAAKALQGFVVNECLAGYADMASAAYELADAMLEARENIDSQKQGA